MRNVFTIKRILQGAVAAIVILSIFFFGGLLASYWGEHGQVFWARLYRTKAEISEIDQASVLFRKMHGAYPASLVELAKEETRGQSALTIPINPWGSPYYLEQSDNGNKPKIWTIPDEDTRKRLEVTELSNLTDWPGILHKRYRLFWR